ncbi:hypothetical protein AB0L06_30990 [Spirillospora sp. NPDC052269]
MLPKKAALRMMAISLTTLSLSAIPATAAVAQTPCEVDQLMPGSHIAFQSSSGNTLGRISLFYDSCGYNVWASIGGAGVYGDHQVLSVDLVAGDGVNDSSAHVISHADNSGTFDNRVDINMVDLKAYAPPKFFQARGFVKDDQTGCSIYFDSDWHGFSYGADTGGGWDGDC